MRVGEKERERFDGWIVYFLQAQSTISGKIDRVRVRERVREKRERDCESGRKGERQRF